MNLKGRSCDRLVLDYCIDHLHPDRTIGIELRVFIWELTNESVAGENSCILLFPIKYLR